MARELAAAVTASRGSFLLAAALFVVDPVSLGLGLVAALGSLVALAVAGGLMLRAWLRRDGNAVRAGLLRSTAFLLTGGLGITSALFDFRLAERRADRVVFALRTYRAERGRLPPTLSALAPRYIPRVPSPRLLSSARSFLYEAERAELSYVLGPLMGRVYNLSDGTSRPLD